MQDVAWRRAGLASHNFADLAKQEPHNLGVRGFGVPRDYEVVAPSLTPESYNDYFPHLKQVKVVAPSLTPESYNSPPSNPCQPWLTGV